MGMYESLFPEEAKEEARLEKDLKNICKKCFLVKPCECDE